MYVESRFLSSVVWLMDAGGLKSALFPQTPYFWPSQKWVAEDTDYGESRTLLNLLKISLNVAVLVAVLITRGLFLTRLQPFTWQRGTSARKVRWSLMSRYISSFLSVLLKKKRYFLTFKVISALFFSRI